MPPLALGSPESSQIKAEAAVAEALKKVESCLVAADVFVHSMHEYDICFGFNRRQRINPSVMASAAGAVGPAERRHKEDFPCRAFCR